MMPKNSALIICNGEIRDYLYIKKYINENQMIICADGGIRHLQALNIEPDLILGDFDSAVHSEIIKLQSKGAEIMKYPPEKDFTDTELALEEAVKRGMNNITFMGATGTRLDHTLANVCLLKKASELGAKALIVNEYNEIYFVDSSIKVKSEESFKISILPFEGGAKGVTTKGLYYPLYNAYLPFGPARGISNEFTEEWAEVSVKEGSLIVIKARD
jgi:thiamine pyrophosphokinase